MSLLLTGTYSIPMYADLEGLESQVKSYYRYLGKVDR